MNEFKWRKAIPAIEKIKVTAPPGNVPVEVGSHHNSVRCIGVGTDAAVFVHAACPEYAFKVYAEGKEEVKANEEEAYRMLPASPYFPVFYGAGHRYIVMSFEQGLSLYDCLVTGVHIPSDVIPQVDKAIETARGAGLNPRDIHLKNIILQQDGIKLIDVSEYVKKGNDQRWEHLKKAYELYYPLIASKKIPLKYLDFAKKKYEKHKQGVFSSSRTKRLIAALLEKEKPS